MKRILFTMMLGGTLIFNLSAQTNTEQSDSLSENSKSVAETVDDAFTKLLRASNTFRAYKVISQSGIQDLQSDTKRQIGALESTVTRLNAEIEDLHAEVDQSEKELKRTNSALQEAQVNKDQLSFLGIKIMKNTYQVLVTLIIVILLVLLITFIRSYQASNRGTVKAQKDLKEIQVAFDEYRQRALETQQKLGRQLQDERNKNTIR